MSELRYDSEQSGRTIYLPSLWRHAAFLIRYAAVPSATVVLVMITEWSPWIDLPLLALSGWIPIQSFPGSYWRYRLVVDDEGFRYEPRARRAKYIPWSKVTAYRFAGTWARLIHEGETVQFLFEKPLLIQRPREFRREVKRRCSNARRLSLVDWLALVWRSAKEAWRDSNTA